MVKRSLGGRHPEISPKNIIELSHCKTIGGGNTTGKEQSLPTRAKEI
jgi:hypothetical protein